MKAEKNQAPGYAVLPTVVMQEEDGWKQYCSELKEVMREHVKADERVTALAESLRANPEPLKTLYSHIERMVRSSQPDLGTMPLGYLTDAGKVYADGYGNGADMAILYAAILEECGARPELILVSSGMKYEPLQQFWKKHPSDTLFNHVVLRAKDWQTGQVVWLNDLSQYGEPGTTNFEGCLAYNLTKGGFFTIKAEKQYRTCTAEQSIIELKSDASAEITIKRQVSGTDFEELNAKYSNMLEEQRRRHYETVISSFSMNAEALTPLETHFDEYPGRVEYSVKVPDFSVMEGDFCYFNLLQNISGVVALDGDQRSTPMMWRNTTHCEYDVRIRKPLGYPEIELAPADFEWISPNKNCRISVKQESSGSVQELRYIIKVDMEPELFGANRYEELQELYRKLASEEATLIVLRRPKM